MTRAGRRGVLQIIALSAGGLIWTACRRNPGGSPPPAIPTLADISHIQATRTAYPGQLAETGGSPPAPSATPSGAGESEASPRPAERAWPSVRRHPTGVLVTSPLERFYETRYRNASPRPEIAIADWQLSIEGWVETPRTLGFEDITALPRIEVMRTLECISNPVGGTLIGNTVWKGVRLAEVLALAGVRSGAREIRMSAADGYETSIPLDLATDPDALLVFEMDGNPLPVKHGYPVRVLLPGRYGQKQPKWITRIEVITDRFLGYWESRGWSNEARVQVNSQIWEPAGLTRLSGREALLQGIAFADESGIARVEVSTDGGRSWQEAELRPGPDSLVWTEWRYVWELPEVSEPERVTLAVRAVDGHGNTQRPVPEGGGVLSDTFPDGTSDIHRIVVTLEPVS